MGSSVGLDDGLTEGCFVGRRVGAGVQQAPGGLAFKQGSVFQDASQHFV